MMEKNSELHNDCKAINAFDLVEYLESLGFAPSYHKGNNYWYHSPLREERTPSFKVNRKINLWYDFGTCEGGSLIDFGMRYHKSSVGEFLQSWRDQNFPKASQEHRVPVQLHEDPKLIIDSVSALISPVLLAYLNSRKIDAAIAQRYCREVKFELNSKSYFAIGFQNQSGGWELRNSYQKYASAPKDISLIANQGSKLLVFEGFMDFLSFQSISKQGTENKHDVMILNGIGFFERARPQMESYSCRELYFDQDAAGKAKIAYAVGLDKGYVDKSNFYKGYKDLNEWLVAKSGLPNPKKRRSRKL